TLKIWDPLNGTHCIELNIQLAQIGYCNHIKCICILADDLIVCSDSYSNFILLDLKSNKSTIHRVNEYTPDITCICSLSDGQFVSGSYDGKILIWESSS